MIGDHTAVSRYQQPTDTSASRDQPPTTPKLPFDPPRRRSSLAFSRVIDSPAKTQTRDTAPRQDDGIGSPNPALRPNIGRKRTFGTPLRQLEPSSEPAAHMDRVIHTARANLHLDIHFAASPVGSIDSRLPHEGPHLTSEQDQDMIPNHPDPVWRYSTAPKLFSSASMDVREPMPETSPTLPPVSSQSSVHNGTLSVEPTSSGFASPASAEPMSVEDDDIIDLPPLPSSSPPRVTTSYEDVIDPLFISNTMSGDLPDLTEPMTELRVGNEFDSRGKQMLDQMDDSPIIDHLQRRSGADYDMLTNMPDLPDGIFLSRSARAAAESAKAKRNLLRQAYNSTANRQETRFTGRCPDPTVHSGTVTGCPDPGMHQYVSKTPCPDPTVHFRPNIAESFPDHPDAMRAPSHSSTNRHLTPRNFVTGTKAPSMVGQRTTADGSPMPFLRRTFSPHLDGTHRSLFVPSPPPDVYRATHSPGVCRVPQHAQRPSEHFRPGWYYAGSSATQTASSTKPYSFSTAAAKVTGESVAPDSRIRDSYRTDTLTLLARPPGRFRKNGIAATLRPSGSKRYNRGPGLPRRPSLRRMPVSGRHLGPSRLRDIQIRSSPPRSSGRYMETPSDRKNDANAAMMPQFELAEDESAASTRTSIRFKPGDELMRVDTRTRDAVRMSLFGPDAQNTSDREQDSMKELSPNVSIWRRGMPIDAQFRKKRRPSYWDDDLEEVRMSPAGRGGIESSPTMSKTSMVAELENMHRHAETLVADENIISTDSFDARPDDKVNEEEVNMIDAVELEAH